MKIFFGAAIQGARNREERAVAHRQIVDAIKSCDCEVVSCNNSWSFVSIRGQLFF